MNPAKTITDELETTIGKARVLTDALPYIQSFRGSTIVIKYGGRAMIDERLKQSVARDVVLLESVGIKPVVVHGGGPEISSLMERLGLEPEFHQGQRVTDAATLEVTEMVLAGKLRGEIVTRITTAGGRAVGLSGKDDGLLLARKIDNQSDKDMGFVGEIERVRPDLLDLLSREQIVPVISPIGAGADGQTYNINADYAAAEIAAAIGARKLVLLTDVPGILRDPADPSTRIQSIPVGEVEGLIKDGVISGGMIPKVRACQRAIGGGVRKTHILDGTMDHALLLELFTSEGIGTEILSEAAQ